MSTKHTTDNKPKSARRSGKQPTTNPKAQSARASNQPHGRPSGGPTEELVRKISADKKEPEWMLEKRLESLKLYREMSLPKWGPDLSGLDMGKISYYVDPKNREQSQWEEVPEEVRKTFDKLGIPEAEKKYLGGVGAQYDSGMVYHKLRESLQKKGVIFENMDVALEKYPDMVKKYFMTDCVKPGEHIFAALHGAVWSGGTFIYVPKGVEVGMPLQAYFFMAERGSAQFEHTLIIADEDSSVEYIEGCSAPRYNTSSLHAGCVEVFVERGARMKYASIENWSHNTFNLNTKRAIVKADAHMTWVGGNMGSGVTMLYPSSVLVGEGAQTHNLGVVIAGKGQVQDTGAKAIHLASHTHSTIHSKSVSKDGGIANYRGLIKVKKGLTGVSASLVCDSLLLDEASIANTYPAVENASQSVEISHEARIGKIGEDEIFYLKTRGFSEEETVRLVVGGFLGPIIKELPLEYALELNKLIDLEMEGGY